MLLHITALALAIGADPQPVVTPVPGQAPLGTVEIHGVKAGPFTPAHWEAHTLHWMADMRWPLLVPRQGGVFRNIYAPSVVETPDGWRLFYGAWDGIDTGNDQIYSILTRDFIDFYDRSTVIANGEFIHACNVNALRYEDGSYELVCTVYPDANGRNKPAYFTSEDGNVWNGRPQPCPAGPDDIVAINGYEKYKDADINGMNVILREGNTLHLYFNNFKDFGRVYRASTSNPPDFEFEAASLEAPHVVNDVKRFDVGGEAWYLMGLHMNRADTWYALSRDGLHFGPEQPLVSSLGGADRYIVAVGWVCEGPRLLGVLYGAGAVPGLNRNRIFARWLQKRIVFTAEDGTRFEGMEAMGPDRVLIPLPLESVTGRFEVYAEDGVTRLGDSVPATIASGGIVQLTFEE
jgi:hypothetical protein